MQTLIAEFTVINEGLHIQNLRDAKTNTPIKTLTLDNVEIVTNTKDLFAQIGAEGCVTLEITKDKTIAHVTLAT